MTKRALIFGVSGQDGAYLSRLLVSKGYDVYGVSRDAETQAFTHLVRLGIRDRVKVHSASLLDFRELLQLIGAIKPDEIYNLAGQSSVGLSFAQPVRSLETVTIGTIQILEVMRYLKEPIKFYNASSSECFGNIQHGQSCDEHSRFAPLSPYAVAKAAAYWAATNYRTAYGLYACSGLLFNHESVLRPERFVTAKIVATARRIAAGDRIKLELGDLEVYRDWGYAAEYVEAMWLMMQQEQPDDYVIATGESHSIVEFVTAVFEAFRLDWREHVVVNRALFRPSDIRYSQGNPDKSSTVLGWKARTRFFSLIDMLVGGIV